ncbi:MAG: 4-hydroxythreonine-4-phosphate dehydrogenase PdxA [Desulfobacteraceae bacterium]|nr:4-hydroxythreonine-4-phosphate dehydrogenase PdxA [Desulfobacteraceae bacterium]
MNAERPVIGITMGDPVGIGPEIIVSALEQPDLYSWCRPLVLGDQSVMERALALKASTLAIRRADTPENGRYDFGAIDLMPLSHLESKGLTPGAPTPETGRAMIDYITRGVDLAMDNQIQAIATCPITKTAMKLAESEFHGHTELIAHRTNTPKVAMMMAGDRLRVVLVTIHIPLAEVAPRLNREEIINTIRLTSNALTGRFGIKSPRIAVAGLNPHAGEDGMFGTEEEKIITPAVDQARKEGFNVSGPYPPDTLFFNAADGKFDAVVCMYHDQGLIPFKMIHFSDGVNTTLGLPIIRTSVDHGTAYDIAWKGVADPSSLVAAIRMAALQAKTSRQQS